MKTYTLTEDQFKSVMRLSDAARLLAVALPAPYTQTPIGSLKQLTDDLGWVIFIDPNKESVA